MIFSIGGGYFSRCRISVSGEIFGEIVDYKKGVDKMRMGKILLFAVVLMMTVSSLGAASAGWLDFGSDTNQCNISGMTFNIPGDFKEVDDPSTAINEDDDFNGLDVETKCFEYNVSSGGSYMANEIAVSVISGSDVTLEDVYDFDEYYVNLWNDENLDIEDEDFNKTTIGNKTGLLYGISTEDASGTLNHYIFYYMEGDKLVNVELYGNAPDIDYSQLEEIIGT